MYSTLPSSHSSPGSTAPSPQNGSTPVEVLTSVVIGPVLAEVLLVDTSVVGVAVVPLDVSPIVVVVGVVVVVVDVDVPVVLMLVLDSVSAVVMASSPHPESPTPHSQDHAITREPRRD